MNKTIKSDVLLLLTAAIWGMAFAAQRIGMDYVGPYTFNGIRFALGALVLLPLILKNFSRGNHQAAAGKTAGLKTTFTGGMIAGVALFIGASLQQVGLVYTTAGKAGFITGLYVVFVPILSLAVKGGEKTTAGTWTGAGLAAVGLYFLSVTKSFTMEFGDLLTLFGAFVWAAHVIIIGKLSPGTDSILLAFFQFVACAILSMLAAVSLENIEWNGIVGATIPILYGGCISVGIAYTLQVVAQKNAHPAHAAVILSLESVFAALGGWIVLGETLSSRGFTGCALMLFGMLTSQLWKPARAKQTMGEI